MAYLVIYEGLIEVYIMLLDGGVFICWIYFEGLKVVGWIFGGKIIYSVGEFSKLFSLQLVMFDLVIKQKFILLLFFVYSGI